MKPRRYFTLHDTVVFTAKWSRTTFECRFFDTSSTRFFSLTNIKFTFSQSKFVIFSQTDWSQFSASDASWMLLAGFLFLDWEKVEKVYQAWQQFMLKMLLWRVTMFISLKFALEIFSTVFLKWITYMTLSWLTVRSAAENCFRDINQELLHETSEATWCRGRTSHLFDLLPSLSPETSQLVLSSPFTAPSYNSIINLFSVTAVLYFEPSPS